MGDEAHRSFDNGGVKARSRWWKNDSATTTTKQTKALIAEIDEETRKQLTALGYVEGIEMNDLVEEQP